MGTIDTLRFNNASIRIGNDTFEAIDTVPFRIWLRVMVAMTLAKIEKRRTRKQLARLTAEQLQDIGISIYDADREVRKSFPMYVRNV